MSEDFCMKKQWNYCPHLHGDYAVKLIYVGMYIY